MRKALLWGCLILISLAAVWWYARRSGRLELSRLTPEERCARHYIEVMETTGCDERWVRFLKYRPECNNKEFECPPPEGFCTYDEIAWTIESCFEQAKQEDKVVEVLKTLAEGPSWVVNGPTACPQNVAAAARLEARSYPEGTCLKEKDLQSWIGQPFDFSLDRLKSLARNDKALTTGALLVDSDAYCTEPLSMQVKNLQPGTQLRAEKIGVSDNGKAKWMKLVDQNNTRKLAPVFEVQEGCAWLTGIHYYEANDPDF